jgi:large subunit ribosomal protein L9
MVNVILREDVAGVGKSGDLKQVKDGFARNFLFPRKLALEATTGNLKYVEAEAKKKAVKKDLEKKKAQELAARLANFSVTIAVEVNEDGKLYGSLSAQDIAKAVSAEGVDIDKGDIAMEAPLKELGIFDLDIRLHQEVIAKIKVWVVKK